jgi:hypothetical protein
MYEEVMIELMAMGASVAFIGMLIAMQIGKKMWPYTYVNTEDRQNGSVAEILKGRIIVDKMNIKKFELKQTFLDNGLGAFQSKPIITSPPAREDIIIKKSGGGLVISSSPAPNIYNTYKIVKIDGTVPDSEIINNYKIVKKDGSPIDEEALKPYKIIKNEQNKLLVEQLVDNINFFKSEIIQWGRAEILNPKKGWLGQHPEATIIAAGIIVVMIWVVGFAVIAPIINGQNAQLSTQVAQIWASVNGAGTALAQSGATVIPPVG